ncbi:MAG: molybdopterin-dependent oxidoreductase [Desulfuromonas sp.]|nr:molybdopterin-dependent oxidoreductase [Desulfuromonas sp.]
MRITLTRSITALLFFLYLGSSTLAADTTSPTEPLLTITGAVNHPMQLTLADLQRLQSVEVQHNEVTSNGAYHGVFHHRAVPLRTLLAMANIEQKGSTFKKPVDATIVLSDAKGKKVVLSWGEIFYHNPAEVVLSYESTPVLPTKNNCTMCHEPEDFQFAMQQLYRPIALSKLVITGDFYSDRFLEGVVNIDVVDVRPAITVNRDARLFSPQIHINGAVSNPLHITSLKRYPRRQITKKVVGVGRGYHGLHTFSGTPLAVILKDAGAKLQMDQIVILSATDGYRSSFSMGELMVSTLGEQILLADTADGDPIEQGGKFRVIVGPDYTDDRDVQAITTIEVIRLKSD